MRGEFLDLNGIRLYYYAAGSRGAGEPIVLLHGFPTSSHLWSDVVPLLPAGHRVVVLDLLGFGRSDRPTQAAPVSFRAHADRVVTVLDHLGINFACIVGHDVGGGVAQLVAVRSPQRVSRLCLIDSVAFDAWPPRSIKLANAMMPLTRHLPPGVLMSMTRRELLKGYVDPDKGAHDVDVYLRPFLDEPGRDALVAHLRMLEGAEMEAVAARLGDVVSPTAILWGERDPFLPVSVGRRLHEAIRGSTFEVLPGAKHFVPEESASNVAATIAKLLLRA